MSALITIEELLRYHRQHVDGGDDECYEYIQLKGRKLWPESSMAQPVAPATIEAELNLIALDDLELDYETLDRNIAANRESCLQDPRVQQFLQQQQNHRQQFEAELERRGLGKTSNNNNNNGNGSSKKKVMLNY